MLPKTIAFLSIVLCAFLSTTWAVNGCYKGVKGLNDVMTWAPTTGELFTKSATAACASYCFVRLGQTYQMFDMFLGSDVTNMESQPLKYKNLKVCTSDFCNNPSKTVACSSTSGTTPAVPANPTKPAAPAAPAAPTGGSGRTTGGTSGGGSGGTFGGHSCYVGVFGLQPVVPWSPGPQATTLNSVCVSYCFTCAKGAKDKRGCVPGQTGCTAGKSGCTPGRQYQNFQILSSAAASLLQSDPMVKNLKTCVANNCNDPFTVPQTC